MESRKRFALGIIKEPIKDLLYAEVWSLFNMPQHAKQRLRERGIEWDDEEPEEYKEFEKVYFLNEVALRMYREGGIALDGVKKVSVTEMPKRCKRHLRVPYIPR